MISVGMNLVAQYQEASKSVARIEAVKGVGNDGMPTGSVGSGFVVTGRRLWLA